ncbi:MAG: hypothetical protein AAF525_02265 [Pseudomonadota bacterium]
MQPDDIERVLANEKMITPSAGYVDRVMMAVNDDLTMLPQTSFPWRRLGPGYLVTILTLILGVWQLIQSPATSSPGSSAIATMAMDMGVQWLLLAVVVTIVAIAIPSLLMQGRSYP